MLKAEPVTETVACKAKSIYSLALYRRSLQTLIQKLFL